MAKKWSTPNGMVIAKSVVHGIFTRWDKDENDKKFRQRLRSETWEVVVPRLLLEHKRSSPPENRHPILQGVSNNALAGTVIGLIKTEAIHQQSTWKNVEDVEFATLTWVDWFNNRRLLEPISDRPPAEKENEYYQQRGESATAA